MMYPILCKVHFEELNLVFKQKALWKQLAFSFVANWIIAPLIMVVSDLLSLTAGWPSLGILTGQGRLSRRVDSCWLSPLHCYGRSSTSVTKC